jgi:hypothetical protein
MRRRVVRGLAVAMLAAYIIPASIAEGYLGTWHRPIEVPWVNKVLGFTKLEPEPGRPAELHVGSLNVDENYQRYALANTLLELVKAKIEAGTIVHSQARPQLNVLPDYVGRYGRVITGLDYEQPDPQKPVIPLFRLIGDRAANQEYQLFNQPLETIKRSYPGTNAYTLSDDQFVAYRPKRVGLLAVFLPLLACN